MKTLCIASEDARDQIPIEQMAKYLSAVMLKPDHAVSFCANVKCIAINGFLLTIGFTFTLRNESSMTARPVQ